MSLPLILVSILVLLVSFVEPAEAAGLTFGDAMAFILCTGIAVVGVLACLGQYSRRISSGQY